MSFPISGGGPSGPGLDPAADEAASQPASPHTPSYPPSSSHVRAGPSALSGLSMLSAPSAPLVARSALAPGASALIPSAGRTSGGPDQPRGEFYLGDVPIRTYLLSENAERVKVQLKTSLEKLAQVLPGPGQQRSLEPAIIRLWRDMEHHNRVSAEMLGHGKRWLEQLVYQLERPAPLSSGDREDICDELVRALTIDSMSPARAFGCALHTLQARIPRGSEANGFRSMLQERALSIWIGSQADMAQRVHKFGVHEVATALMEGFGFPPDRPRLRRPLPTVSAEELNQAAGAIENRLDAQVLPLAHDILTRVSTCFGLAYRYQPQSLTLLSVDEQSHLTPTLIYLQRAMGIDLMNTLRIFSASSGPFWSLADLSQLASRIRALLPELTPADRSPDTARDGDMPPDPLTDPLAQAMVALAPPSEGEGSTSSSANSSPEMEVRSASRQEKGQDRSQDSGSGATGTFNAGTGGANRRGPT